MCCCCCSLHRHQIHLISYGCVAFGLLTTGFVFTVFAIFYKDSDIGKVWLAGPTTMVVGLVLCGKVFIDWGPAMLHAREGSIDSRLGGQLMSTNIALNNMANQAAVFENTQPQPPVFSNQASLKYNSAPVDVSSCPQHCNQAGVQCFGSPGRGEPTYMPYSGEFHQKQFETCEGFVPPQQSAPVSMKQIYVQNHHQEPEYSTEPVRVKAGSSVDMASYGVFMNQQMNTENNNHHHSSLPQYVPPRGVSASHTNLYTSPSQLNQSRKASSPLLHMTHPAVRNMPYSPQRNRFDCSCHKSGGPSSQPVNYGSVRRASDQVPSRSHLYQGETFVYNGKNYFI